MSFRDFMNAPRPVTATSVCKYCDATIEKRGGDSAWNAIGDKAGYVKDLCLKATRGNHVPVKR